MTAAVLSATPASFYVIPAKAGISCRKATARLDETPASAGVTSLGGRGR